MSDNYTLETAPLFRLLRTPAFRFIVVSFNHYEMVRRLEADLRAHFPDRPIASLDCGRVVYQDIREAFNNLEKGFLLLFDFQEALAAGSSPDDEQKRHITAGLNLRRDYWAQRPVALIVFVRADTGKLPLRALMEKMPDLWSFRSIVLELSHEDTPANNDPSLLPITGELDRVLALDEQEQRELAYLQEQLAQASAEETAYRLALYPQIIALLKKSGRYDLALALTDPWEKELPANDRSEAWMEKGKLLTRLGRPREAQSCYQATINHFEQALRESPENSSLCIGLANALYFLGHLEAQLGRPEEARKLYNQAINLYKKEQKDLGLADALLALGDLESRLGRPDEARSLYNQAISLYQKEQDELGLAHALKALGDLESILGRPDEARNLYNQAIILYQKEQAELGLANALLALGILEAQLGRPDEARNLYNQAIILYKKEQAELGLANALQALGNLALKEQNFLAANTFFEQAIVLYQNEQEPQGLALSLMWSSVCHLALGETQKVHSLAQEAMHYAPLTGNPQIVAIVTNILTNADIIPPA